MPRYEFLRYDLKSGELVPVLSGLSGTELEYSRDGKWVAYVEVPGGSLWRSASDGTQRLRLTSPPLRVRHPHWSPDGTHVAFNAANGGSESRIYVVPFEGGSLKQVSNGESGKAGDWDASWSPDGASLAFGCDFTVVRNGAVHAVYVVDLKTGRVSTLPGSLGIWSPRWSPDGRLMAGLSVANGKIVLYDFRTRKQSEVSRPLCGYPFWSRDGESLFYVTFGDDLSWWRLRRRDRKTERIMSVPEEQAGIPVVCDGSQQFPHH
ncbi:MAG: TolB family protein [Bryobacteraceae bacterium]